MVKPKEKHVDVNGIFQELHNDFSECNDEYVVMSHFGEFSQDLVNSLSEGLEYIMLSREAARMITKRMFTIMIEGLQNIRLHGARNNSGKQFGHVMILENDGTYAVSFGNIVDKFSKDILSKHLNKLNNMNPMEIKELYLATLSNGMMTDKGGAGLGFITIALKSKSDISFQFIEFEENTFYFEMRVRLT
ncbi:MAG TPA: SiaB family protein kinase [Brumimicrobium sp.]|nr:SiaB family protein kinase [Brumimicrobium sp.]